MCNLTLSAFEAGCLDISGIESLYFVSKKARETAGISYAISEGVLTITGTGGNAYLVKPVQNSFAVTNPVTASPDANSLFYTQTMTGTLHGNSAALKTLVQNINKGRTECLVKYTNGNLEMFGTDVAGLQATGGDGQASGQAAGDPKGATINLSGQSTYIAPNVATFEMFENAFSIVNSPS